MEKVINVDIKEMDDLVERYNEEVVSKDLKLLLIKNLILDMMLLR